MKTETITWHELPADGMPDAEIHDADRRVRVCGAVRRQHAVQGDAAAPVLGVGA
jgi:hypothetical protein